MTFRNGHITFDDFNRLVALTEFDRAYLDQEGRCSGNAPPLQGCAGAELSPLTASAVLCRGCRRDLRGR